MNLMKTDKKKKALKVSIKWRIFINMLKTTPVEFSLRPFIKNSLSLIQPHDSKYKVHNIHQILNLITTYFEFKFNKCLPDSLWI